MGCREARRKGGIGEGDGKRRLCRVWAHYDASGVSSSKRKGSVGQKKI